MENYVLIGDNDADGLAAAKLLIAVRGRPKEIHLSHDAYLVNKLASKISGENIVILDKSDKSNSFGIDKLLENNSVELFDHHVTRKSSAVHPGFHVNSLEDYCTARVVAEELKPSISYVPEWVAVGLFGDLRNATAERVSKEIGLLPTDTDACRRVAQLTNYSSKASMRDTRDLLDVMLAADRPEQVLESKAYSNLEEEYRYAEAQLDTTALIPEEVVPGVFLLDFSLQPEALYWDAGRNVFEDVVKRGGKTLVVYTNNLHTVMDAENAASIAEKLGGGGRKFAGGFPFEGSFGDFKGHIRSKLFKE